MYFSKIECSYSGLELQNPWDVIQFSGNARIHLDSFLSVFNISGLPEEYYHNSMRSLCALFYICCHINFKPSSIIVWKVCIKLIAGRLSNDGDTFVDGAIIAAARTLPTWSDGDVPPIPSMERRSVKELQEECRQMLAAYPTNSKQDQKILGEVAMQILKYLGKHRGHYIFLVLVSVVTYG